MHSAIVAQLWEIWSRRRTAASLGIGITAFGCLFHAIFNERLHADEGGRFVLGLLDFHAGLAVLLLTLATFSYVEAHPQSGSTGFPQRLFVLPVTSFQLVAVPMLLAVAGIEIVVWVWTRFSVNPDDRSPMVALTLGVYVVLFQTILWTLPRLRSMRMLVLGMTGVILIMLPIFPSVRRLSNAEFVSSLVGLAFLAFLTSWICVARQRSGAVWSLRWIKSQAEPRLNRPPQRDRDFGSADAAQFWLEWRRSGLVLPLLVGSLLVIVIGPLSAYWRNDGMDSLRILAATLAMPLILALAVGKAFSKPDLWYRELSIPGFIAVRPLSSEDIVAIKMKVAAVSAAVSWGLVLAFLSLWLPLWANLESFATIRGIVWMIYGHRLYPQYAMAVLVVIGAMVLTWRFMVGGLWLGLSGNTKVFALSAFPYVVVPLFVLPFFLITEKPIITWMQDNARQWLPVAVWVAAAAVVIKFWLAAFSWRKIKPAYIRQYLPVWFGCTACLIALALLLGDLFGTVLAADAYRVRNLMILIALLIAPLARVGLAPSFLDRNRHR